MGLPNMGLPNMGPPRMGFPPTWAFLIWALPNMGQVGEDRIGPGGAELVGDALRPAVVQPGGRPILGRKPIRKPYIRKPLDQLLFNMPGGLGTCLEGGVDQYHWLPLSATDCYWDYY